MITSKQPPEKPLRKYNQIDHRSLNKTPWTAYKNHIELEHNVAKIFRKISPK